MRLNKDLIKRGVSVLAIKTIESESLDGHDGDYYLDRNNHTGEQPTSTITDFNDEVEAIVNSTAQPLDAELTALASTTSGADKLPYYNGSGTATTTDLSSFGRSIIDDANATAVRTTIGAAATSHTHSGADIASGDIAAARIQTNLAAAMAAIGKGLTFSAYDSGTGQVIAGYGFNRVSLATVTYDPFSGWSSGNNWYTIPSTGNYLIITKLRFADGVAQYMSYGQGAHTSEVDGPWFQWFASAPTLAGRNGSINIRIDPFTSGDQIRLFSYNEIGVSTTIQNASMSIIKL